MRKQIEADVRAQLAQNEQRQQCLDPDAMKKKVLPSPLLPSFLKFLNLSLLRLLFLYASSLSVC
jgi:hypothetical protein